MFDRCSDGDRFFLDAIYFASVMVWAMKLFFEVYGWVSLAHQEK